MQILVGFVVEEELEISNSDDVLLRRVAALLTLVQLVVPGKSLDC